MHLAEMGAQHGAPTAGALSEIFSFSACPRSQSLFQSGLVGSTLAPFALAGAINANPVHWADSWAESWPSYIQLCDAVDKFVM